MKLQPGIDPQAAAAACPDDLPDYAHFVLANTPFLLTYCSSDLRYRFASEAYAHMIGRKPSDVVGRKIRDVMGEQGFNTIMPHIAEVLSGKRVEYESQVHFEGIGPRLLHVIYVPQSDEAGRVRGWVASILDITEKRQAQRRIAADYHAAQSLRAIASECVRGDATVTSCLEKVLDAAIAITGAQKGNLQLIDPHSNALWIAVQRGFSKPFLDFFGSVDGETAGACTAALRSKSVVVVSDIRTSEIFAGKASLEVLFREDVRAVISIPLISSKGSVLGVLSTHFSEPHEPEELHFLELLARLAADFVQRKRAEEIEQTLVREVQHRSNNLLAVVQGLASRSLAGKDYDAFANRLLALARSNQRIASSSTGRMSIVESVSDQLGPFSDRVKMQGPDLMITGQQVQDIGLLMHELVTNAVKYGALSDANGTVEINWQHGPDSHLRLTWKERGGPQVVQPVRAGLGTRLLTGTIPNSRIDYAADGLYWQADLKLI